MCDTLLIASVASQRERERERTLSQRTPLQRTLNNLTEPHSRSHSGSSTCVTINTINNLTARPQYHKLACNTMPFKYLLLQSASVASLFVLAKVHHCLQYYHQHYLHYNASHTITIPLSDNHQFINVIPWLPLGDEGSGKSSFIARLQGRRYNPEDQLLGTGLEYTYLDVRDEESEGTLAKMVYTPSNPTAPRFPHRNRWSLWNVYFGWQSRSCAFDKICLLGTDFSRYYVYFRRRLLSSLVIWDIQYAHRCSDCSSPCQVDYGVIGKMGSSS